MTRSTFRWQQIAGPGVPPKNGACQFPYLVQQPSHTHSLQFPTTGHCPLATAHWPLPTDHWPLPTGHCPWTVGPFRPSLVRGDTPRNAPLQLCHRARASPTGVSATGRQYHRACALPACRQRAADTMPPCPLAATRSPVRPAPTVPTASSPSASGHWLPATGYRPPATGYRPLATIHYPLPRRNPLPPSPARVSETCYTARSSPKTTRLDPNAPHHTPARPPCPGRKLCRPAPNRTSESCPKRTSLRALPVTTRNAQNCRPPRRPPTVL